MRKKGRGNKIALFFRSYFCAFTPLAYFPLCMEGEEIGTDLREVLETFQGVA